MSEQFSCPFCGDYASGNKGSVKAHITRMTDDLHAGLSGPDFDGDIQTVAITDGGSVDSGETSGTDSPEPDSPEQASGSEASGSESGSDTSGSVVPSEFQASRESSGCCSNPSLEGSAGDYYRLESGAVVELEEGDEICVNCDEIHG